MRCLVDLVTRQTNKCERDTLRHESSQNHWCRMWFEAIARWYTHNDWRFQRANCLLCLASLIDLLIVGWIVLFTALTCYRSPEQWSTASPVTTSSGWKSHLGKREDALRLPTHTHTYVPSIKLYFTYVFLTSQCILHVSILYAVMMVCIHFLLFHNAESKEVLFVLVMYIFLHGNCQN